VFETYLGDAPDASFTDNSTSLKDIHSSLPLVENARRREARILRYARRLAAGLTMMVAFMAHSYAQTPSGDSPKLRTDREKTWGFFVAPYGWLTGVDGTVASGVESIDIDIPFDEFLKRTQAGFMLYAEARRKRLFVAFDGTWATLEGESDLVLLDLDVEVKQQIYDIRVGYQVLGSKLGEVIRRSKFDWQRRLIVDVFAGGRYFDTEPSIEITPIIGNPSSVSSGESRIDPFLGARVVWDMSYRWLLGFRGDVGGFGIGDAADFTWQATAEVGFRSSRRVAVGAGYRVLEYDTIEGEGDGRSGYDLRMSGAIVGLGFSF